MTVLKKQASIYIGNHNTPTTLQYHFFFENEILRNLSQTWLMMWVCIVEVLRSDSGDNKFVCLCQIKYSFSLSSYDESHILTLRETNKLTVSTITSLNFYCTYPLSSISIIHLDVNDSNSFFLLFRVWSSVKVKNFSVPFHPSSITSKPLFRRERILLLSPLQL